MTTNNQSPEEIALSCIYINGQDPHLMKMNSYMTHSDDISVNKIADAILAERQKQEALEKEVLVLRECLKNYAYPAPGWPEVGISIAAKLLSNPSPSIQKLEAKLEAGEKMASEIEKFLDEPDFLSHTLREALEQYRKACE